MSIYPLRINILSSNLLSQVDLVIEVMIYRSSSSPNISTNMLKYMGVLLVETNIFLHFNYKSSFRSFFDVRSRELEFRTKAVGMLIVE